MKVPGLIALAGICVVLLTQTARAATEQWTFDGSNGVYQVVADGAGGCAILRLLSGSGEIVWLDKKGAILYQTGVSNIIAGSIAVCTPKDLVYADNRGSLAVYHVNKKGTVQKLDADPNTVNTVQTLFPLLYNNIADKTGFFAVKNQTNTMTHTVIRYSNK